MNCYRFVALSFRAIAVAGLVIGSAGMSIAALQFGAAGTLNNPSNGATFHTGGQPGTGVSFTTSGMAVSITGASANQSFNVQYTLQLELDSGPVSGTVDSTAGTIITCTPAGTWNHNSAANTSATPFVSAGGHSATCYVDIVDNGNSANHANKTDTHSFTVVNP